METILAIAFGRTVNLQKGEADELTLAAQGIFRNAEKDTFPLARTILSNFPFLIGFLRWRLSTNLELMKPQIVLYETALSLVKARREETRSSASKVCCPFCIALNITMHAYILCANVSCSA